MKEKPYKATSLSGAEREVRRLRKHIKHITALWEEAHADRLAFAKLAAEGPCFDNPIVVFEAKARRDEILKTWCGLNADGTRA